MPRRRPLLTVEQILAWADAHYARTGKWPTFASGPVLEAPGETWAAIASALHRGNRGLPGGHGLAWLRDRHRGTGTGRVPVTWTALEDELVRTLPVREAAERTGRTLRAVCQRRRQLSVSRPGRPGAETG
jgi:hypothetical protein